MRTKLFVSASLTVALFLTGQAVYGQSGTGPRGLLGTRPQQSARLGQRAELQTVLMPCRRSRSLTDSNSGPVGILIRSQSGFFIKPEYYHKPAATQMTEAR